MTKKCLSAVFGILLLAGLANAVQAGQEGKAQAGTRALKVKMHYTGSGTVDEKHKIFIVLFNSADFMQGNLPPIATNTASSKEETVTFSDLSDSPVYAAVIYDPSGNYDGQSPPPAGSSTALYSKTPGVPEPITIDQGKTAEVVLAFNDSHKMK